MYLHQLPDAEELISIKSTTGGTDIFGADGAFEWAKAQNSTSTVDFLVKVEVLNILGQMKGPHCQDIISNFRLNLYNSDFFLDKSFLIDFIQAAIDDEENILTFYLLVHHEIFKKSGKVHDNLLSLLLFLSLSFHFSVHLFLQSSKSLSQLSIIFQAFVHHYCSLIIYPFFYSTLTFTSLFTLFLHFFILFPSILSLNSLLFFSTLLFTLLV